MDPLRIILFLVIYKDLGGPGAYPPTKLILGPNDYKPFVFNFIGDLKVDFKWGLQRKLQWEFQGILFSLVENGNILT